MKMFYSWQSDTPSVIGKSFIRAALDDAVSMITDEMELDEADRPSVDQDTQGVMGSPPIAETIFDKIRNANVVVVDVTLVGATPEGKKLINSNVAYELGFAHGHHGDHVILKIMNAHFGDPDDLPFDLKHRRWPIRFELAPGADKSERQKRQVSLSKELAAILGEYLKNRQSDAPYEPVQSTLNPAVYWQSQDFLVPEQTHCSGDHVPPQNYGGELAYIFLHLWPDRPLADLSGAELGDYNRTVIPPLLNRSSGFDFCRNKYGTITYWGNETEIYTSTQVFKNREIWGIETFILRPRKGRDIDNIIPGTAFEEGVIRSMRNYLVSAKEKLGYGNIVNFQAGLIGVEGYRLTLPREYWDQFAGTLFQDVVVEGEMDSDDEDSVNLALLKIFEEVFDSAGSQRPENLHGFPPVKTEGR